MRLGVCDRLPGLQSPPVAAPTPVRAPLVRSSPDRCAAWATHPREHPVLQVLRSVVVGPAGQRRPPQGCESRGVPYMIRIASKHGLVHGSAGTHLVAINIASPRLVIRSMLHCVRYVQQSYISPITNVLWGG